jgi:hypothetical protein
VLVSKNGHVDDEAPKKSLTDAVGKCLSLLGFAADVHMGLWDGDKYTAEAAKQKPETKAPAQQKQSTAALMRRFMDRADKCENDDDITMLLQRSYDDRKGLKAEHNQMLEYYAAHRSAVFNGIPSDDLILDAVSKLNALRGKK